MSDSISEDTRINDIRSSGEFSGISFSGYSRAEVKKQLIQSLLKSKVEPACHWCAELVCAGQYSDIWDCVLYFVGKHIHGGNPKIPVYIEARYSVFCNIIAQGFFADEMQLCNNASIRKLFAEMMCVLALSDKGHSLEPIKINQAEEFDTTLLREHLKAPSTRYAEPVFRKEDPKELYVALNELCFCLEGDAPDTMDACYWIEWIAEFDALCRKRKQKCVCERRADAKVDPKLQKDCVWLVWDALIHAGVAKGAFVEKAIRALRTIFCIRYSTAAGRKRRFLLYFAASLAIEPVRTGTELIKPAVRPVVESVLTQIDSVYKTIKKNEKSPGTDYLFMGMSDRQNVFDRSVNQLKLMEEMDIGISRDTDP